MLIITLALFGYVSADTEFKDVKKSDWYAEAIGKLDTLDIVNGLPDGSFNPQGEVTRAQFIKMLVQAMEYKKIDSVSFVDMKPHWASVYVETALRNKVIIKAEEGDRFYPDAPISRKDMVMMMCRALELEPSEGANPYYDLEEAEGYFTKAYEEYLVRGIPINGKIVFNPRGVTTR
ncbi:MAG: S-layer homology domain-containing protein, partial [Clostridiaceae bacterium]|nr:S-layer homology domain-containing protein [Clostridiaceae bacterium]